MFIWLLLFVQSLKWTAQPHKAHLNDYGTCWSFRTPTYIELSLKSTYVVTYLQSFIKSLILPDISWLLLTTGKYLTI